MIRTDAIVPSGDFSSGKMAVDRKTAIEPAGLPKARIPSGRNRRSVTTNRDFAAIQFADESHSNRQRLPEKALAA
jgi:hypothetical protein